MGGVGSGMDGVGRTVGVGKSVVIEVVCSNV